MPEITNINLNPDIDFERGQDLICDITGTFKFEDYEKEIEWEVFMEFYDQDLCTKDDFLCDRTSEKFKPSQLEEKEKQFHEIIKKEELKKRIFKKELKVKLTIQPFIKYKPFSKFSDVEKV